MQTHFILKFKTQLTSTLPMLWPFWSTVGKSLKCRRVALIKGSSLNKIPLNYGKFRMFIKFGERNKKEREEWKEFAMQLLHPFCTKLTPSCSWKNVAIFPKEFRELAKTCACHCLVDRWRMLKPTLYFSAKFNLVPCLTSLRFMKFLLTMHSICNMVPFWP